MEINDKKALIGLTVLAAVLVTAAIIHHSKKKPEEKKSNVGGPHGGGHPGGNPGRPPGYFPGRAGYRDIYGGSYVFPYTPLYGYDQCTYTDKNGLLVAAPCAQSMGWSRSW